VASAIVEAVEGGGDLEADNSASGCSESAKRRQPDSVITLTVQPPLRKCSHGDTQPAAAGWLRGEAEHGALGSWVVRGREWRGPG
jgi:hypothetical protein